MTDRPLVSVIIPYYHDTETIERALVSVADQSFADFEIIIVDDYSSQVLGDFHVPGCTAPLRVIRHDENKGVAAARNTGILSSAGRWVAFLDADDVWHADKLARQITALEAGTACGSVTGFALYRDHAGPPEIHIPNDPAPLLHQLALGCTLSPGSTLIVLREVFNDIGLYDDRLRRLEDWDWLIRFAKHYQLVALPECLAHIHVSRKKQSQNLIPILGASAVIRERFLPVMTKIGRRRHFLSTLLLENAAAYFRARRWVPAIVMAVRASILQPMIIGRIAKRFLSIDR